MNKGPETSNIVASAALEMKYRILQIGGNDIESNFRRNYTSALKFFQLNRNSPKYFMMGSAFIFLITLSGQKFHFKVFEYFSCGASLIVSATFLYTYCSDKAKFQNYLRIYNTSAQNRKMEVLDQLSQACANDR